MSRILFLRLCAALVVLAPLSASAQDLDYLSLTDSTLAVVRNISMEDLEAELDAISTLLSSYERNKRDADHHRQLILKSIEGIEKEIDITKTKIELAKKEERYDDRDSLMLDRADLEAKKDYFEQAEKVRNHERRHAQALVDWTKRVRTYYEKAVQLMEERERGGRDHDLIVLEKELIKEQEEAAERLKDVSSEMAKVASTREDMYKKREKLLNPKK